MLRRNIIPISVLVVIAAFFMQPELVYTGASKGIILWYNNILPFLLPMFILSNILLQYNFLYTLLERISFVSRGLVKSSYGIIPYIISIISGYPSGAVSLDLMVKSNKMTKAEANYLIPFTNICSFAFISSVVVFSMLKDTSLLIYIALPHYIGAIILCRFIPVSFKEISKSSGEKIKYTSFNQAFSSAIYKSITSILTIAGVIILFSILSEYLIKLVSLWKTDLLNGQTITIINSLIIGVLEVTNGCSMITNSSLPVEVQLVLLNFIISFSGLSVTFQTISVINNYKINFMQYMRYKLLFGLISAVLCIVLLVFI